MRIGWMQKVMVNKSTQLTSTIPMRALSSFTSNLQTVAQANQRPKTKRRASMMRVGMDELKEGPHASRVPKLLMHPTRPDPWKVALTCCNSLPSDVLSRVEVYVMWSLKRVNMRDFHHPVNEL